MNRIIVSTIAAMCFCFSSASHAALVTYLAPTGQTATADFSFVDGNTLRIVLTETTPLANSVSGADAVLVTVGFDLPGTVQLVAAGSTVVINAGSSAANFSLGALAAGADVSREYGVTQGQFNPGIGSVWDYVSGNESHVTQLAGTNRDGPDGLNGPQGGLLDDSAAVGGTGIIDNSVIMTIELNATLTGAEQSAFLTNVLTNSIVEYGSDYAFGRPNGGQNPIPEPATLAIWGFGLGLAGAIGRKRIRRA